MWKPIVALFEFPIPGYFFLKEIFHTILRFALLRWYYYIFTFFLGEPCKALIHKIPILKMRHEKVTNHPSQSFNHSAKLWTRWLRNLNGTTEKYLLLIMARHGVYERL